MEKQSVHQSRRKSECSIQEIEEFCRKLLENLELDLTLDGAKEEDGIIQLNIAGADRSYLLSNSASLLNSTEYLLNKIFPGRGDEAPGILLDSEKYRQHRELELKLLAQMASQKVIALKKPLTLQAMIPRERRIVHLALAEIEGVHSQSEGEGDNRSITIYPS